VPDVASVLKQEISRIARKEITAAVRQQAKQIQNLKSTVRGLREQVASLNQSVAKLSKAASRQVAEPQQLEEASPVRISPKGIRKHRQRLKLSQGEMARMLGVSPASVGFWETGRTKPQGDNRTAIAELRTMGIKEARAKLDALGD
jgi:DNA-binding transcriptional regulator YiaG